MALAGTRRWRGPTAPATVSEGWPLTLSSALLYALAFNATFFIQELFLVIPKALTPGLRPTLFHNNHTWQGDHPLASLFQGTGAAAILLSGLACAILARPSTDRPPTVRLFLIWLTYSGLFMALPQVVMGAVFPRNDVGMAMEYLRLGSPLRVALALAALAAIPPIALRLVRALLALAGPADLASAEARNAFVFRAATLPGFLAIPLIVLFRVPREFVEVVVLPALVTGVGIVWMQAGAWRVAAEPRVRGERAPSVTVPAAALAALLLVFQIVLRPGLRFYRE
jgi:hypothetical protein